MQLNMALKVESAPTWAIFWTHVSALIPQCGQNIFPIAPLMERVDFQITSSKRPRTMLIMTLLTLVIEMTRNVFVSTPFAKVTSLFCITLSMMLILFSLQAPQARRLFDATVPQWLGWAMDSQGNGEEANAACPQFFIGPKVTLSSNRV